MILFMNFLNLIISIKIIILNQLVKFLGENKLFNKIAAKYADKGIDLFKIY